MPKEYKIGMVDETPPKPYTNSYGTTYYIVVGLEGHSKPVSIGKKKPDALKVGDTVYGTIIPTDFETDKWKGETMPQQSNSQDKADYEPGTNARWAIRMAYQAFVHATGTPEDAGGEFPFDAVKQHATELLKMFDELKAGVKEAPKEEKSLSNEWQKKSKPAIPWMQDGEPLPEYQGEQS